MSSSAPAASAPVANDLGLDREFVLKMASWPVIAVGFTALAWLSHFVSPFGPVALLCLGMIVAAVIDGWAFKVPNWLTLPMVLSGWGIGLLHDFGIAVGPGPIDPIYREGAAALGGGVSVALLGTAIGFAMIFPALFMGGMGQGDVKMQMGFGSWVGALYGGHEGPWTLVYAVCAGMIVGGVMGVVMMLMRGNLRKNASNFREILSDFKVLAQAGPKYASERARTRRASWHRLPYGIPLCIGFVGYLVYLYATAA
ncbi:MAG: A24 family peptidase [Gemmataceae bacterium]|nr:A24 family peptidase [Gemmataceae bacterium]